MTQAKYRAVADEAGRWSVVDRDSDMPAVLDGVPQVGMDQDEAEGVAEALNTMTDDEDG